MTDPLSALSIDDSPVLMGHSEPFAISRSHVDIHAREAVVLHVSGRPIARNLEEGERSFRRDTFMIHAQ